MPDPTYPFDGEGASGPVEIAPRIWWVGPVLADDVFQNHAYLIEAGDHSVLVDPGSTITIDATLDKVRAVMPLDQIRTIVVHHSDPDVADALHRLDEVLDPDRVTIVTEWRSELLMRHYGSRLPFRTIEDLGWRLPLEGDRSLEFVLTPYLHFPGAFVSYEPSSGTLLSADLFGGFNRARRLVAAHVDDLEDLRQFHEHYMPSREILMTGLASIRAAAPVIRTIAPQHGYVIPDSLVNAAFDRLNGLECGVFLQSRRDTHLRRLLEVATAVRHVEEALQDGSAPELVSEIAARELGAILPVDHVWLEVAEESGRSAPDTVALRFSTEDPELGHHRGAFTSQDSRHVTVPVTLDDGRAAAAVVSLREDIEIPAELTSMFATLAPAVRAECSALLLEYEAESRNRLLADAAYTDPLTGVANRRALDEVLRPPCPDGVLMLDIDHFKRVNDTFGHAVGDEVLRRVAGRVTESLRDGAQVFRYGGEEFAVVVDTDDADALAAVAERVRDRVEALDVTDVMGVDARITVSVGARQRVADEDLATALERADAALYRAKESGRNRVELA